MLKNYFTVAFRSFLRNKFHSLINVAGLGLGITCCLLISLFVRDEWTFDRFHSKAHSIYRAYVKEDYGPNEQFFNTVTPFPLGETLRRNFPEIESAVRICPNDAQIKLNDKRLNESITIVDEDFFNVFDFKVIEGSADNVLSSPSNIVITRRMAEKYFGTTAAAINGTLSIALENTFEDFSVRAVVEDVPGNSSIRFDFLASSALFPKLYNERLLTSGWFNVFAETYILLKPGTDVESLSGKFPALMQSVLSDDYAKSKFFVGLQPLTDIHLNTSFPTGIADVSNPQYSYILTAVAILILLLACINFITLAVGSTLHRAKEVGIRKVVGAVRKQIIFQFIAEAVLITSIALIAGVALAGVCLPGFNDIAGKSLVLKFDNFNVSIVAALLVVIGLLAGSYPAFFLSDFRPIAILKGKLQSSGKQTLRKILVGVQLVFAIFLVSSAIVMVRQLNYLQNKDLGFNKEQTVVLQLTPQDASERLGQQVTHTFEKAELFKTEFLKIPTVRTACTAIHDFGNGDWMNVGYTDDEGNYRTFYTNVIDEVFIPSMQIALVEGRNFTNSQSDARHGLIVNEAFVKAYGWPSGLGHRIPGKNFADHEIIGVVKDFNYASLYTDVQPLVLVMDMPLLLSGLENIAINNSPVPKVFLKLSTENLTQSLKDIETTWNRIASGEDFAFSFIDEAMNRQYRHDQNLAKIIQIATVLSILIGSLGLYALASLTMQGRVREISIRKVFGATSRSLLYILSKDFFAVILLSMALSIPFTVMFIHRWLEPFKYRVHVSWDVFVLAGVISLAIGVITLSYHAIRVSMAQPGQTLKTE